MLHKQNQLPWRVSMEQITRSYFHLRNWIVWFLLFVPGTFKNSRLCSLVVDFQCSWRLYYNTQTHDGVTFLLYIALTSKNQESWKGRVRSQHDLWIRTTQLSVELTPINHNTYKQGRTMCVELWLYWRVQPNPTVECPTDPTSTVTKKRWYCLGASH